MKAFQLYNINSKNQKNGNLHFLPTDNKIIFVLEIIQITSHSSTEFLKMFITFFYRPSKFGEFYHTSWVCKEC